MKGDSSLHREPKKIKEEDERRCGQEEQKKKKGGGLPGSNRTAQKNYSEKGNSLLVFIETIQTPSRNLTSEYVPVKLGVGM
jgi:hypothetical protein